MTTNQQIEKYKLAIEYAQKHIRQLENILADKDYLIDHLIERVIDIRVDELGEDKKETCREFYQDIYEFFVPDGSRHLFLSKCPNKYLSKEEQEEWFDEASDRYVTRDPIANSSYLDLMKYELSTLTTERAAVTGPVNVRTCLMKGGI